MKFKVYWRQMPKNKRIAFAKGCGTSVQNIERKYYNAEQVPRRDRLEKMVELALPNVSRNEMFEHFYPVSNGDSAA